MAREVTVTVSTQQSPPDALSFLGRSRMSRRMSDAAEAMQMWPQADGMLNVFVAAESFHRAGLDCHILDCVTHARQVFSEDDETPVPGGPDVMAGLVTNYPENHSNNAVVLVRDGKCAVLFDPCLYRLRRPGFPALPLMVASTAHNDLLDIFGRRTAASTEHYRRAVEWFVRAPDGVGVIKLSWVVYDGQPSWACEANGLQQHARALVMVSGLARFSRIGTAMAGFG